MSLTIDTYDRRHLEAMIDLYNRLTAHEPHIAELTPQLFVDLIEPRSYFDPAGLFVARRDGDVVGWAHASIAHGTEIWHDPVPTHAHIDLLIFPREDLPVGRALVARAVEWLKPRGHKTIEGIGAVHGYPFYRGLWVGGERINPVSLPQLHLALASEGFVVQGEGSLKTMTLRQRPKLLPAAVEVEYHESPLEMKHETIRDSWRGFEPMVIKAIVDGKEVGTIGWVLLPYHASRMGAPGVSIYMLHVADSQRRKGIGAALISRALGLAYARGARFASVGTQIDNVAANVTYEKLGMHTHQLVSSRQLRLE